MNWLRQWQRGPIAALIVAWVLCSGALLTLYFITQVRLAQRDFDEMGFRLGPGAAGVHVNWLAMWPQLLAYYFAIVVVPPAVLWLLWRNARSSR
jgi:hypothetical protein